MSKSTYIPHKQVVIGCLLNLFDLIFVLSLDLEKPPPLTIDRPSLTFRVSLLTGHHKELAEAKIVFTVHLYSTYKIRQVWQVDALVIAHPR